MKQIIKSSGSNGSGLSQKLLLLLVLLLSGGTYDNHSIALTYVFLGAVHMNFWLPVGLCHAFRSKNVLDINLLKPTGQVMHQQFNIKKLYSLPTLYLRGSYRKS